MTRAEKIRVRLLAAGLSSDVSVKAVDQGFTLSKLRRATAAELSGHFSDEEIAFIKERLQRSKIAAPVVFRLLDESNGQCCICWNFSSDAPIIFHHIEEHSKSADDSYDNLAVLCLNHHGLAHTRSGLARLALPPEIIHERKRRWIEAVAAHRKGERVAPGSEIGLPHRPVPRPPAIGTQVLGRSVECETIGSMILSNVSRIAIRGMGGVGKTVLALEVAHKFSQSFPGGVLWASLGDYSGDADALLRHWARLTGAELPEGINTTELADELRNWLADFSAVRGRQLVILDDARIDWMNEVKAIGRAVPANAVLLITSRDLPVTAAVNCRVVELDVLEREYALDLLEYHAGDELRLIDEGTANELVQLLGNLPLALELLGKHVGGKQRKPGFQLSILVTELQKERLNRLKLPGHPALAAVFALSYGSLPETEKRAFRNLGVFSGTLIPSAHLAGILQAEREKIEESLDYLVSTSLLNWAEDKGIYRLHPLLREYSIALLTRKKTEVQRARSNHLRYFARLVSDRSPNLGAGIWEQYLPELVHAIKSAGRDDPEIVLSLADDLWAESGVLGTRGYYREAAVLLDAAASAAKRLGRLESAAAHTGNLGNTYSVLGENTKAKQCYHRALDMVNKLDDKFDRPAFLGNLGMLLQQEGDWKGAYRHYEEALASALEVGNYETALNQFGNLASLMRRRDPAMARYYYETGSQLAKRVRHVGLQALFISNLGLLHFDAGEFEKSEECVREALELARRTGDRKAEANRLGHLGNLAVARGDDAKAIRCFEQAVAINREIGYMAREADWLSNLGLALWRTGDKAAGIRLVAEALRLSTASMHVEAQGLNHLRMAVMLKEAGDLEAAAAHFNAAREILGKIEFPATLTQL
jgi:tetratricopeptide (TPR) repeat protein